MIIASILVLTACTTVPKAPRATSAKEALNFELKPEQGREEKQRIHSYSSTKTYEAGQIRNEKEEIVDFTVHTVIDVVDLQKKTFSTQIETLEKDGMVELGELAFPEVGDVLLVDMNFHSEVSRAGEYPPDSIYFVPQVSLPKTSVRVGDTWALTHTFVSLKNGLPMRLEMVSILKGLYECPYVKAKAEKMGMCADIELSGEVIIPKELVTAKAELRSRMRGRLLLSIDTGAQIWSEMRNEETLLSDDNRVEVVSCLESMLIEPTAEKWVYKKSPDCSPMTPFQNRIPGN